MADSPFGISTERGSAACHPWPAMILCEPTSVVITVPAGEAERTVVTTSEGFSRPASYPACQASRSAVRCAATSASDQRGAPSTDASSHDSAAATFPTTSVAAGYTWSVLGVVSMCSTGTDSRHGVMSSTGSNPAVMIRSAEASRFQMTRCPAMSRTPAK